MNASGSVEGGDRLSVLTLGRRSVVYSLGTLAYKGVAIVSLPIIARLLSPSELGLLDLAAVMASVIGLIAAVGTDQGVAYLHTRTERTAGVWTSALTIISAVAGAIFVAAALAGGPIATWLIGDAANAPIVVAAAAYGWVLALTTTALNAIRLHGSPRAYAVSSFVIVTAEMAAALTVALVVESPVGLMILAWAGGALVIVLPLLARYVPDVQPPSRTTIRRLVSFGAPLIPAAVAWLAGDLWIRAALAQQEPLATLGAYGIGFRLASVATLAVAGFGVAWQPYIFSSPPHDVRGRAAAALAFLIAGLGVVAIALTMFATEIIGVVAGDGYAPARDVVGPLSAAAVAQGAFVLVAAVVAAAGSTRAIAAAAVAGVVAQIILAPSLVSALGLVGAGYASVAGYSVALGVLLTQTRGMLREGGAKVAAATAIAVSIGLVVATASQDWHLGLRGLTLGVVVILVAAIVIPRWQAEIQGR